jgi:Xaa-Pro aminopeptidase
MPVMPDTVSYLDHGCRTALAASDAGRTLRLRDLTRDERLAYSALESSLCVGREFLASHATSSAVHRAMSSSIGAFPDAIVQGHGIGVEIREYPLLVPAADRRLRDECVDISADLQLRAGMVVNLEASLFGLGDASLHMEETFIITKSGAEALVQDEIGSEAFADGLQSIERA